MAATEVLHHPTNPLPLIGQRESSHLPQPPPLPLLFLTESLRTQGRQHRRGPLAVFLRLPLQPLLPPQGEALPEAMLVLVGGSSVEWQLTRAILEAGEEEEVVGEVGEGFLVE